MQGTENKKYYIYPEARNPYKTWIQNFGWKKNPINLQKPIWKKLDVRRTPTC